MKVFKSGIAQFYQYLKKFSDNLNLHFLPTWKKVSEERKKCIPEPEDIKLDDDEITASIMSTLDNYMKRSLQDLDEKEKIDKLKEEHGNRIKFKLIYKVGYDGSTQKAYKVCMIIFITYSQMNHKIRLCKSV